MSPKLRLCLALGALIGPFFPSQSALTAEPASPTYIGRASVTDGDTLEIRGTRIRLYGIDAPESGQTCKRAGTTTYRCGQQSALALQKLIADRTVECKQRDVDRYGRIVAVCYAGKSDLNASQVKQGWARAYRQYSTDYIALEDAAKRNKLGIWAGEFQNPWDYRRGPTDQEKQASAGCLIKGNISRDGRRLYHLPGTSAYGKTKINTHKGERWFCSEREALASGWLPALKK